MPNWCENDIVITGPEADLEAMLKLFGGDAIDASRPAVLDFDKIVPYPQRFKDLDEHASAEQERIDNLPGAERDGHLAACGRPKNGFLQGGNRWCVENWGTKLPARGTSAVSRSPGRMEATFYTAWSPPIPAIMAASRRFPTLLFDITFYERGNKFEGHALVENGEKRMESSGYYGGSRGGCIRPGDASDAAQALPH